ncbi:MAG TPA: FliI/YscN family ATPase [Gemmatimonadales bacterium]|jgi:FliI/YscN family ATPase
MTDTLLEPALARLRGVRRLALLGRVTRVVGSVIEASSLPVAVGEVCRLATSSHSVLALVAGFHERGVMLLPVGELEGIHPGATVTPLGRSLYVSVGDGLVGRVLDGLGRPIDGKGPVGPTVSRPLLGQPPTPLERTRVDTPFSTGVRAIDGLESFGRGQRVGIMAGSGVGKSVLLGMIARGASSDVNVIALLGERGREVREFVERDLGPEGLARSVVVVATSDQSAVLRATGALVATSIAEHFRDQGKHALLLMDSVTRVAMAWREVGLSVGEPPTTKGYPPSVFVGLPKLLERAGTGKIGSITGLYTVLVEGDDFNEPVADAARSILDGHVVLARRLAAARHFPAVDVLESVSRVRDAVIDPEHRQAANTLIRLEAAHRAHEDLIAVGAYKPGADRAVDTAIAIRPEMMALLMQRPDEPGEFRGTRAAVISLATRALQIEKQGHR